MCNYLRPVDKQSRRKYMQQKVQNVNRLA
jgi:hypothetical protein